MFKPKDAFSSFSVDDLEKARQFYGETLGLEVSESAMGTLQVQLPSGSRVMIYPKNNHEAATFTVLNLVAGDVEQAVDELNSLGVQTKIYDDPAMPTDAKGIMKEGGMAIAWFKDPAGNVLSVVSA
ncbi:VOC family protein [Arthrobacter sp. LjRoot78]|uniref:VOC family protein n=1 Tax=Arthrobacter sp. LjRoot78 TaxID=3342338 RepID=UPI003ED110ED